MASSNWAPDTFSCPICLETLKDPATLSCGHTYCLVCIQKHWDRSANKGVYECPQCRQKFDPRPVLARSSILMEAMEKLRLGGRDDVPDSSDAGSCSVSRGGLYPDLPSHSPPLCSLHQQVLDLYCCDDKEDICEDCSLVGHKGHRVIRADEDQKKIQQDLMEMNVQIKKRIDDRERRIQNLPQVSQAHKMSMQKLTMESQTFFSDIIKNIDLNRSQVLQLLQAHENSSCSRIEVQIYKLQQEINHLREKEEDLKKIDDIQDPESFLNSVKSDLRGQSDDVVMEIWNPESVISDVTSTLETYRQQLDDLNKTSLAKIFRVVNDAAAAAQMRNDGDVDTRNSHQSSQNNQIKSDATKPKIKTPSSQPSQEHQKNQNKNQNKNPSRPSTEPVEGAAAVCCTFKPAPKTREEMLKFRTDLTFDRDSAYRHIRLSDGNRKVTLCAENQNYPENPKRFTYWRQVMCVETLAGSPYYWEVEWTGQRVTVGVAYGDMERSTANDASRLGHNPNSWSLYWSGKVFSLWHDGKETSLDAQKSRRIGIYLDQQEGLLAFYRISHNQAQEICSVHTHFHGSLIPSFRFWSGVGSSISICELE